MMLRSTLALILVAVSRLAAADADPSFHLYLLIGQSNMAGRGVVDAESKVSDPHVLMLDKGLAWVPAVDPLHFDKPAAGVGPGLAFGKAMAKAAPDKRIGLIPCAIGGTSIRSWEPGAADVSTKTHPYDDMLVRVKAAREAGVFKGILWNQGESDRGMGKGYAVKLAALVARLRKDLDAPELPFVAGELAQLNPELTEKTAAFNAILHGCEPEIRHFSVVSAKELQHKGDKLHLDAASARILGQRYAEAMTALQAAH